MNILLYGAGAVGLGLASCLLKAGERVDLIGREETVSALKSNGLQRTGLFGDYQTTPESFGAYASLKDLPKAEYDFILVCTKSFDTRSAAEQIAGFPLLKNASTPIVLCQNGWGNAEIFAEMFSRDRIKSGRVITGFRRPHKHQVDITVHADRHSPRLVVWSRRIRTRNIERGHHCRWHSLRSDSHHQQRPVGEDALQLHAQRTQHGVRCALWLARRVCAYPGVDGKHCA